MKKILLYILFIVSIVQLNFFQAQAGEKKVDILNSFTQKNIDSENSKLKKEIKDSIVKIYGKEKSDEIFNNVMMHAQKAIEARPQDLKMQDLTREDDWYKKEIIYMFYVDQFGVISDENKNTFNDTALMFDYLEDLGVTTLYMLPFADSPMKDAGFDVKNPQNVRSDLGGLAEFKNFIKEAKKRGFKIKSDLVLNHFSDDHEWFQKLQAGDESYLDYFVYTDKMPEYKRYQDPKLGTVIEYKEDDGSISKRRIIFPENTETNYRKVTVNGKDYFLYHTFYPFQLDINWMNPDVLYYVLDTISYWANLGTDIFRMDAIPYLSKDKGTNAENQPKTHEIITLLSNYIQLSAPSSVIQVEACQPPKDILHYFGKERQVELNIENKTKSLKRTSEAQIAYHFPYMPAIWASLISEDKKYFIDAYKKTPPIPQSATWAMFLRVHDELTLEMVNPEVREIVFENLVDKGASFRKGFGVSGRLANFLDKNPDRIEQAFAILLSLPGVPIIYYGDEVGAANNFDNAKEAANLRAKNKNSKANLLSAFDSRDINRGKVPQKLFYGSTKGYYEFNSKVYAKVRNLISLRKAHPALVDGNFEILKTTAASSFAYIRNNGKQQILVLNNLSGRKLITEIAIPKTYINDKNGNITILKNLINNTNIKVNLSRENNVVHLKLKPYQAVWIKL